MTLPVLKLAMLVLTHELRSLDLCTSNDASGRDTKENPVLKKPPVMVTVACGRLVDESIRVPVTYSKRFEKESLSASASGN